MGFRAERTLYALSFEGRADLAGLEVAAKAMPLENFLSLQRLAARADTDADAAETICRKLAKVVVSWNLEDPEDGHAIPVAYALCKVSGQPGTPGEACRVCGSGKEDPEPCEYDGLVSLEFPLVLTIFQAYMAAVASVPKASVNSSSSGGTSLALSIPMEPA